MKSESFVEYREFEGVPEEWKGITQDDSGV